MTSSERQASVTNEQDIANQWIDYLKRKNANSTMLWIFFLVVALVATGISAWLFWQQHGAKTLLAETALALENVVTERDDALRLNTSLKASLVESQGNYVSAKKMIEELQSTQGETGSQLDLTTRLVSALKQKVATVESENSLLEEALVESEAKARKIVAQAQRDQKTSQQQRQSLSARKSAYDALVKRQVETQEEMQRLASELSEAKEREANLDDRNARLSKELKGSTAQLKKVEEERLSLVAKLETLTMPIMQRVNMAKEAPEPVINAPSIADALTPSTVQTAAVPSVSAAPKAKPKKKKVEVNASPLDFDSIAVE